MENLEAAIPQSLVETALALEFYADDDREFTMGLLLPASWEFCADFCNRAVYPTAADLAAANLPDDTDAVVAPFKFRQAVLLMMGHFYRNREALASNTQVEMPLGARALLWPMRARLGV